jgi:hypothetical protein
MAAHSANGSAKIECSHLIISRVTRVLCRTDLIPITMLREGHESCSAAVRDESYQRSPCPATCSSFCTEKTPGT